MGLLSNFFAKGVDGRPAAGAIDDDVNQIRARAKRRLIGAAVLLAVGVIGFPLMFETKPRNTQGEVPTVVARKDADALAKVVDKAAEKAQESAANPAPTASGLVAGAPVAASAPMIIEKASDAGREVAGAAAATVAATAAAKAAAAREADAQRAKALLQDKPRQVARAEVPTANDTKPVAKKEEPAVVEPKKPEAKKAEVKKAEPKKEEPKKEPPLTAEAPGRFTVQVGAFANDSGVEDARAKLGKAGLRHYTQVLNTTEGKRTRVRTGPFKTRAEAEAAAKKAQSLGMTPTVVPL